MTPSIQISPRTWTLRFKHHRSTILLHVDPLQNFPSIRAELLKAVKQTHPDGELNGISIPASANDILLARPVDGNNLNAGWKQLEKDDDALFAEDEKGKGKGKVSVAKAKGRESVGGCPKDAGLSNGGIVALKFREEMVGSVDGGEDGEGDLEGDTLVGEPERWDVVVPTVEETYGDQDAEMAAK